MFDEGVNYVMFIIFKAQTFVLVTLIIHDKPNILNLIIITAMKKAI